VQKRVIRDDVVLIPRKDHNTTRHTTNHFHDGEHVTINNTLPHNKGKGHERGLLYLITN